MCELYLFILFTYVQYGNCLLCSDIRELPENTKWSMDELSTVPPNEIVECAGFLAKEAIPLPEAEFIWNTMKMFYKKDAGLIPPDKLATLRWITPVLTPKDFENISISSIEIVENFGLDYQLSPAQLEAIAERVREDWADKEPEDYTHYDLKALRNILCAFNRSEIDRIRPAAYREAASALSTIIQCPREVLQGLAMLATDVDAFGSPSNWNLSVIEIIGATIAQTLPQDLLALIPQQSLTNVKNPPNNFNNN